MSAVAEKVRGGRPGRAREAFWGYAFVILPMAVFGIFFLFPMGYAVYISFFDWGFNGADHSVGFDNYRNALHDPLFWRSLRNIGEFTLMVVPAQMALGLFMAVIVNQKIRARPFFRSAFYFPSIASSAAITTIAIFILNSDGLLNHVLGFFGIDHEDAWFAVPKTAMPAIAGLNAWTTSGTMMLFYLASLQAIPNDVYEAAEIDGAKPRQSFFFVTLPLLLPIMLVAITFRLIDAAKLFDIIYTLTRGGPGTQTYTTSYYLYYQGFERFHLGQGTAGAWMFMIVLSVISFWLVRRLLQPVEA